MINGLAQACHSSLYNASLELPDISISYCSSKVSKSCVLGCLHSTSSELHTHPSPPPAAAAITPLVLMFSATHFSSMSRSELRQRTQGRASCVVARRPGRAPAMSCAGTRKHPQGEGKHPQSASIRHASASCAGACSHGRAPAESCSDEGELKRRAQPWASTGGDLQLLAQAWEARAAS